MPGQQSIARKSVWLWVTLYPLLGLLLYDAYDYSRVLTDICLIVAAAYAIGGMLFGVVIYRTVKQTGGPP